MLHTKALKLLLICSVLAFGASYQAEAKWLDKVIVLVEDDVILSSELERRTDSIVKQIKAAGQAVPDDKTLTDQVLERLILESIQLQRARRAGVRISDEELNAAIQRIADGNNMTIPKLSEKLAEDGVSFSLFREDIRGEIMISRVRQGSVNQKVFVSEQEVKDLLKMMDEQGASNIQFKLRHLLISLPETATSSDLDKARDKAQSVIDRFNNGAAFVDMIISDSDGGDALQGGDLGWRSVEQLPTLFADSVVSMNKGQLSAAIRSPNGLHLLWLEDKRGGIETQLVDEINIRHILIKVSAVTSDQKAEARLLDIRKKITDGGSDFSEQAKVYSEDLSSASSGGDLGWAPPEAFKRVYQNNIQDLKDGELSQPFKGTGGWYIVERTGSRQTDQTEDYKRNRARQILHRRKFDEEQEAWTREIREQAYVKIIDDDLK